MQSVRVEPIALLVRPEGSASHTTLVARLRQRLSKWAGGSSPGHLFLGSVASAAFGISDVLTPEKLAPSYVAVLTVRVTLGFGRK
jgi:hypothetical protein